MNRHALSSSPLWLFLLVIVLIVVNAGNVLRVLQASAAASGGLPGWIQGLIGTGWTLGFTWAAIALLRRRPRAAELALWLWIGYVSYSCLRLLIFAEADYDRGRLPFLLVLVGFILIASFGALVWMRRAHPRDAE